MTIPYYKRLQNGLDQRGLSTLPYFTRCSDEDYATISAHLERHVRGVVGVAARCVCGCPLVVATAPRLEDGTPFPTNLYLSYPPLVKALSRLEANQRMEKYNQLLHDNTAIAKSFRQAHELYLVQRNELAGLVGLEPVDEIATMTAGGMPDRVKCLHALAGHSLASGVGKNPIGDLALREIEPAWDASTCICDTIEE